MRQVFLEFKRVLQCSFFYLAVVLVLGGLLFIFIQGQSGYFWQKFAWSAPPHLINDESLALAIGEHYMNWGFEGEHDHEKAALYLERALELSPDLSGPWFHLGRIDFINGQLTRAIQRFNNQIALENTEKSNYYIPAAYLKALTYGFMDQTDKSAQAFESLLTTDVKNPKGWAYFTDLSWVYFKEGRYEDILELMEKEDGGMERYPENPWVLNMYGLALHNTGRSLEANRIFQRAKFGTDELTEDDWMRAYPGNDPRIAPQGLAEFHWTIEENIRITASSSAVVVR